MSIMPPPRPEDHSRHAELTMLEELREAIREGRAIENGTGRERAFQHLKTIFEDARREPDVTGRREGIVKWYGEDDAIPLITSFHAFLASYWDRSVAAKGFMPFSDFFDLLETPKEDVLTIIDRLIDTIRTTYRGFVLYPPPRSGPCF